MSWSPASPAVTLTGSSAGSLSTTSTTTIYYPHTTETGTDSLLYMFLTRPVPFDADDQESVAAIESESAGLVAADTETDYLAYIESDDTGAFTLDTDADTPLSSTFLASKRDASGWTLETVTSYDTDPFTTTTAATLPLKAIADYEDPCCVAIPEDAGGGWLMLLNRKRREGGGVIAKVAEDTLGDVVAYRATEPTFRDEDGAGIDGPVLLVDSLGALPDQPARAWLGVPTAAFVTDPTTGDLALYVYYAVEIPSSPYLSDEETPGGTADYAAAWAASDFADLAASGVGFMACKRVAWEDLEAALAAPADEDAWTADDAVEGTLLGRVRIWLPLPFPRSRVTRLATEILAEHGDFDRVTDPEAEAIDEEADAAAALRRRLPPALRARARPRNDKPTTPVTLDDPRLSLYFRAKGAPGSTPDWTEDRGIWRATAMPDDVSLNAAFGHEGRTTTFGLDFVVQPNADAAPSPDLVIPAGLVATTGDPVRASDPDAARVYSSADGAWQWWLYAGACTEGAATGDAYLGRVIGDDDDGYRDWQDAWTFA